jgi:hypothetical protein
MMTVQCCCCKKIRKDDRWVMTTVPESQMRISHGYCPTCAAKVFAEIRSASHNHRLAAAGNA